MASANAINTVYFLSDGKPNQGDVDAGEVTEWETFLDGHGANAIAVGVGSGLTDPDADLEEVAYPADPVYVSAFADLADALLATVPPQNSVSGNVLYGDDGLPNTGDAGEDDLGADGLGQILKVTYTLDGLTETFDVSSGALVSSGDDTADASYNNVT